MMERKQLRALSALAIGLFALSLTGVRAAENDGLAADFAGFGSGGMVDAPLTIADLAIQPDGKIIAVGTTDNAFAVARFSASGRLDPQFGTGGLTVTSIADNQTSAAAHSVVLQPDGKLLVAGEVATSGGSDMALVRYNANGKLDSAFDGDGKLVIDFERGDDHATALAVDSSKRIVLAGWAEIGGNDDFAAVRLTPSGAFDSQFGSGGKMHLSFGGQDRVCDLLVQADNKIVLFGDTAAEGDSRSRLALARLDTGGMLDPTFDADGKLVPLLAESASAGSIAPYDKGRFVVTGRTASNAFVVARFNHDGPPDTELNGSGVVFTAFDGTPAGANAVTPLPNGDIFVAGSAPNQIAFARYIGNGMLDTDFDGDGKLLLDIAPSPNEMVVAMLRSADGRFIVARGTQLACIFADGTLDAGGRQLTAPVFGQQTDSGAFATLAQPNGKIVSAGLVANDRFDSDIALARHTPAGLLDSSFGTGGVRVVKLPESRETVADGLLQRADGKIVVVGMSRANVNENTNLLLARFNLDGSLDSSCAESGIRTIDLLEGNEDEARRVAQQADGKLLVAATIASAAKTVRQTVLVRFDTNCALDRTFGMQGLVSFEWSNPIEVLALPGNKIMLVDSNEGYASLARLNADGSPDLSFGKEGFRRIELGESGYPSAAAGLPDGKLLLAGWQVTKDENRALLLRRNPDGSADTSFGTDGTTTISFGVNNFSYGLAVGGDGKIAVGGCDQEGTGTAVGLFTANGMLDPALGGDGKTNFAVGGATCVQGLAFSGERLYVGGFARNGPNASFALAAYPINGEQRMVDFAAPNVATVAESAGTATLTMRLNQTATQTVTVQYETTGGTATNGTDYILPAGTLTFAPGQTSKQLRMPVINDTVNEGSETAIIRLRNPVAAALGANSSITVTITDNTPMFARRTYLPLVKR